MRFLGRWRAHIRRSPIYLLLAPSSDTAAATVAAAVSSRQHQMRRSGGGGGYKQLNGDDEPSRLRRWLQLAKRRIIVACRPRNLARLFGAILVSAILLILITKGLGLRRRQLCKCTKFTYSQCQPYNGDCGEGVKRAFCQQKRCTPKRKLVRCRVKCPDGGGGGGGGGVNCAYAVRRQSKWTSCDRGASHKSRILFLQSGSSTDCPPTKTERRPCKSTPRPGKANSGCVYETRGAWSTCDRERNEIINVRRLKSAFKFAANCPMELKTAMRCVKRDGTLKCIYSRWTNWSQCSGGTRHRTRSLIQGSNCGDVTRLVQTCGKVGNY